MVGQETDSFPLSLNLAAGGFVAFGLLHAANPTRIATMACFIAALTVLSALSALESASRPARTARAFPGTRPREVLNPGHGTLTAILHARAFCVGLCLGASAYASLIVHNAPVLSLAKLDTVTEIECVLEGDPVPWGADRYRFSASLVSLHRADGAEFSASGHITAYIPAEAAVLNMPGRLTGKSGGVLAQGRIAYLPGAFRRPNDSRGPTEYDATGWGGEEAWSSPFARFRAATRFRLISALLSRGPFGGFLLALLSGNRDYLEPGLAQRFRDSGLSHVLALSGMHLSIIALLAIKTGRRIGGERLSIRLSLAAMLFFVWFAGSSPSLARALLMAFLLFVARVLGYKPNLLGALALAATAQLAMAPGEVANAAFILSHAALAGILALSGPLSAFLPRWIPRSFRSLASASMAAQMATCGYSAAVFGVFVPFAPIAAIVMGPLATVFLSSGILWLALYLTVPSLGMLLSPAMDLQYALIAWLVRGFSRLPRVPTRVLFPVLLTVIMSVTAAALTLTAHFIARKRRSPDAGFAGL